MAGDQSNAEKSVGGFRSTASAVSAGKDSDFENELIELVRALARAAAREDHRKAFHAETMSSTDAGQK
jgi:hypothetical protein